MSHSRAILLMIGAMGSFALVDMFVKLASSTQGVGQIIAISSAATLAVFTLWVWRDGGRLFVPEALDKVLLIRSAGEVVGAFGIVMALALAPLSSAAIRLFRQGTAPPSL